METFTKRKKEVAARKAVEPVSEETSASQETTRLPVKQFRIEDVSASIFAREYNGITYHSVSFSRSYKDAKGTWKYSRSFDKEDLDKVVKLAQQCSEYLLSLQYPEP